MLEEGLDQSGKAEVRKGKRDQSIQNFKLLKAILPNKGNR